MVRASWRKWGGTTGSTPSPKGRRRRRPSPARSDQRNTVQIVHSACTSTHVWSFSVHFWSSSCLTLTHSYYCTIVVAQNFCSGGVLCGSGAPGEPGAGSDRLPPGSPLPYLSDILDHIGPSHTTGNKSHLAAELGISICSQGHTLNVK